MLCVVCCRAAPRSISGSLVLSSTLLVTLLTFSNHSTSTMGQKSDSMLFLSLRRSRYKIFLLALLSCTVLVMLYYGGSVPLNPAPTGHGQGSAMWSGSASESASIDSADNTANVNCMYRWKDISALLASCSRETERDTCSRETERDRGAGVEGKTVPQTDKVRKSDGLNP